ncbi:MAG: DUF2491 family protein [Alphaproteobacteria bacterium]|nr:DUF2491 family protein [Alphaproteobacteria bacterium]
MSRRRWPALLAAAWLAVAPVVVQTAATAVLVLSPGEAAARSSSSGGYSRPAVRAPSVRTPSVSPRPAPGRIPSTSGGYSRPSAPGWAPRQQPSAPATGSDRALQRQSAGDALQRYRQPGPVAIPQAPLYNRRTPSTGGAPAVPPYAGGGWSPPPYAQSGPSRFGMWDALMMWFLLDSLNRPGHARAFNDNRDDPGFRQWRADADRRAQSDPELRTKLDDLDRQLAALRNETPQPGRLPPDIAPASSSAGGGPGIFVLLLLAAAFALITWWFFRRRSAAAAAAKGGPVGPLDTAKGMLRDKLAGKPYKPALFRVGMTFPLDPTPFLMAGAATKVVAPVQDGANALVSVAAVGHVDAGEVAMERLYLAGSDGWFQLFLDANGVPEECRWFSPIDEVRPADKDEWGFWLDEGEGMIGWPEFQAKDGKTYGRHWLPGERRVPPREWTETIEDARGKRQRKTSAMLYSAPTGLAAPAPPTEYILVSAIEEGGDAWVEVAAGIDVNPAALALA